MIYFHNHLLAHWQINATFNQKPINHTLTLWKQIRIFIIAFKWISNSRHRVKLEKEKSQYNVFDNFEDLT